MAKKFKVAPGGSVMLPNQKMLYAGEIVPSGLSEKFYQSAQESKYILEIQNEADVGQVRNGMVEKAPGQEQNAVIKLVKDGQDLVTQTFETQANLGAPIEINSSDATHWVFDPKLLVGKSVDELNALILERDPKQTPFNTVEEAAAFLSADYKPKQ